MSEARDRLFPPRPILSVSIAVFRSGKVLLAEVQKALGLPDEPLK